MKPAHDLPTQETLAFVRDALPEPCRVLEVGCGRGHLAAELVRLGYQVVGLDADPACVEEARGLGVDARAATFPDLRSDFHEDAYDAVLFTRSLHHVTPLEPALRAASARLRAGGLLVVEDWSWTLVDRATAAWAYGMIRLGRAAGLLRAEEWDLEAEPLRAWRADRRGHEIHDEGAMLAAAQGSFQVGRLERAPYFYRYFARELEGHANGRAVAAAVLDTETRLIASGAIVPLGLRFTGRPWSG